MLSFSTSCNKSVGESINSPYCGNRAIKHGKTRQHKLRYRCKQEACRKTFLLSYTNKACLPSTNELIVNLLREGCGIRSTGRLLSISITTVVRRILSISKGIRKPVIALSKSYEVDEMRTFCRSKQKPLWLVYALETTTNKVADFANGNRTKATLNKVINTLVLSRAASIHTDKLPLYGHLIPDTLHRTSRYGTNHIERTNLTLRIHLKRLNRKTLCFSKRMAMLAACVTIYFWYA